MTDKLTGVHPLLPQHMRKNQYEEALFRCEDDRFELDMIIENGTSAIRALRPHAAVLAALPPEAKTNWKLPQVRAALSLDLKTRIPCSDP